VKFKFKCFIFTGKQYQTLDAIFSVSKNIASTMTKYTLQHPTLLYKYNGFLNYGIPFGMINEI